MSVLKAGTKEANRNQNQNKFEFIKLLHYAPPPFREREVFVPSFNVFALTKA